MPLSKPSIFEKMIDHSSDMVFVLNEDLIIKETNEASRVLLGYSPQELKSRQFLSFIGEDQQEFVRQSIEKAKVGDEEVIFHSPVLTRQRTTVSLRLYILWSAEDHFFYGSATEVFTQQDGAPFFNRYDSFHYLFMYNPMAMVIWDFDTLKIIECNEQAVKQYGYPREEFLTLDVMEIRPKEDIPQILEAIKTEESYNKTEKRWRHLKKNGEIIHVDTFTKIINFKGRRAALVHLIDVTEKVAAEEELHRTYKTLKEYEFALDESSIVAITDTLGVITYVNDYFCAISQYSKEELVGQTHQIINSGHHDRAFYADLWKTIATGGVWRGEIKNRAKDGGIYWVDSTIVPFLDEAGRPYQYMAVRFDITEKKRAEESILYKAQLLTAIAEVISTLFQYDDWELALDKSFNVVGKTISVERVYYFENYFDPNTGEGFANQKIEWSATKSHAQLDNPELQDLPFELISEFIVPLSQRKPFKAIVRHMKESGTKELLVTQDIKSILVLPIFIKDHFHGFIGFDDCENEREWREDEISFLGTLASKLTSAIEKRKNVLDLKEALREKNHILESIGDAFFAVDKNWTVTYWNIKAEQILGTKKEDVLGHNIWDVYKQKTHSIFYVNYHKSLEENLSTHFEVFYAPLGKWVEVSSYPSPSGLSVFFKDISARKQSEERLKKMNKELALSNSELEQFAFVASHDLQEPLRMITSFLSQLEKKYNDLLDDRGRRYIHFASDGAKRMRSIILDLLEFSRIGRTEEDKQIVSLNGLLKEVIALNRKLIKEKRAKIIWDEDLPEIFTFKSPLRLLFQNLINNGLKYQAEGAVPVIQITFKETDLDWDFRVSDNGIGIESQYFDKIFTIFQRLHNKEDYSGTGVGLAICKKIIENLEGEISVESELEKGTHFHFTIPK